MVSAHNYEMFTSDKCAYCGFSKHVSWTPGWPPSRTWYDAAGNEIPGCQWGGPPCGATAEHRMNVDAEMALDRLESVAG
jgi:hypothetical protein